MKYFWGAFLGIVLVSPVWLWQADRTVDRARADERTKLAPVVQRLERDLKRLSLNICGDESLEVEELSYRCAKQ